MKALGVIAEYNPFHHGHAYQLKTIREKEQPDVLIVVMSGNVVQRGEFAILDKWQRTRIALEHGVDLVIELPLLASLQSADYFAQVSIQLLSMLGCQRVVFGTETATTKELLAFDKWLNGTKPHIDQNIKEYLKQGFSYAYSYQQSIEDLKAPLSFDSSSSNHILGLQYIRWNNQLKNPMEVVALPRIQQIDQQPVLSGSQIRQHWYTQQLKKEHVPLATWQALNEGVSVKWQDYWPLLQYRLISDSIETLQQKVGVKEGIERRMKQQATTSSFKAFIDTLTSKRWSKASLQRMCMAILLSMDTKSWQQAKRQYANHPTVRVLGFNNQGRKYLSYLKNNSHLTLFTNLKKDLEKAYQLSLIADRIYQLNHTLKPAEQVIGKHSIYIKN